MTNRADDQSSGQPGSRSKDKATFNQRLNRLEEKLGKIRSEEAQQAEADGDARVRYRGMAYGLRMATELVACVILGGLIGYALDYWLVVTRPWLFLLFFILGCVAGVRTVIKGYNKLQTEIAEQTGGDIGHAIPDDDDD